MPIEFGTVRITVPPGYRAQDVEFPGPGLYEAVFDVPQWMMGPDFHVVHDRTFTVAGHRIQPIWTVYDSKTRALVFRLRIHDDIDTHTPDTLKNPAGATLTIGNVIRGYGDILTTWVMQNFLSHVMDSLREIRKIVELPVAALVAAGAVVVLGVVH